MLVGAEMYVQYGGDIQRQYSIGCVATACGLFCYGDGVVGVAHLRKRGGKISPFEASTHADEQKSLFMMN